MLATSRDTGIGRFTLALACLNVICGVNHTPPDSISSIGASDMQRRPVGGCMLADEKHHGLQQWFVFFVSVFAFARLLAGGVLLLLAGGSYA